MSLAAVCVDRGRLIVKEPTGVRVEGRSSFAAVTGQWFRCRLFLTNTTDVAEAARWVSSSAPQMLCVNHDIDGNPLVLRGDYAVEVRSKELGRAIWRMQGEPEPLRKKRRVIGYLAVLSRVVEREFDDLLGERAPDMNDLLPPGVV